MLLCAPVMAIDKNSVQSPSLYIESNELDIDELKGVSEYRGAVQFSRGDIQLQADKVKVIERQHEIYKVIAQGRPAFFQQENAAGLEVMRCEAEKIEYLLSEDSLLLLGKARLWQDGNEFSGDRIEYNLSAKTIVARGDKEQHGRVRIIIQPKKHKDAPQPLLLDGENNKKMLSEESAP